MARIDTGHGERITVLHVDPEPDVPASFCESLKEDIKTDSGREFSNS